METRMNEIARIMVANGYGFGKYGAGYIFAKSAKDNFFLYLADKKMAVLSAGMDEDGEKEILIAGDRLTHEELSPYFRLDFEKKSHIDWLEMPVNVLMYSEQAPVMKNNLIYYMYPAVKLNFSSEITANTLVIYDRFTSPALLEKLKSEAETKNISDKVEFWNMLKLLAVGHSFGELAPKMCISEIPNKHIHIIRRAHAK